MSIEFSKVDFTYNEGTPFEKRAIFDIDLSIEKGEFLSVIGHTGSGKSTLIQHMNVLLQPTKGTVKIFDKTIYSDRKNKKVNNVRKKVGLVFQFPEYQLFEETVEKDIMFGPTNFGVSKEEAKLKAKEVIQLVGLDESFLEKSPLNLSGGQMRRVAIAGILAMDPEVLVLDEPTAGLDPQGRIELMSIFQKLNKELGKTIILITHDMNVVVEYASRVIIMHHGKKVYDGCVKQIFDNEELVYKYNLDVPDTVKFLMQYKKLSNKKVDISKFTLDELLAELNNHLK